ncbi:Arc family DNA-binding protein [Microvirga arsenatis]|uniref:Arc family DNA-binding protein n=1 Tax=Microvirga arsenatis TaxID=2692265 RepID=A0ABW9Z0D9_9HYPH|nr:Arc family DNA-binding protein [Microvirga arsenatis]NBJ13340.1 Arc family DNA-binding protein [Microvirga arsenatis]NBJ24124.1 Arc family DNA-binding protein [Microvirga arsenatis]
MSREDPHFRLRFPEELRAKVEKAAEANRRSMTAEILARLERSFDKEQRFDILSRMSKEALLQVAIDQIDRNQETLAEIREALELFQAAPASTKKRDIKPSPSSEGEE